MSSVMTAAPVTTGAAVSIPRRWCGYLLVAATLFLIWWGGQVKSHEAGLSVPDWPLSYGTLNPPLVGNVFWEHLHRVIAASVGLITVVLAVWTARAERRTWVVRLGWVCVAAVIVQGLLGGANVRTLLFMPVTFAHSTLAQIFLCLVAWWAYSGSPEGVQGPAPAALPGRAPGSAPGAPATRPAAGRVGRAARLALAAVFVQLLLGVLVRHTESGLAVPFFLISPTGAWLPEFINDQVVIHMLHRSFALVAAGTVLRAGWMAVSELKHAFGHGLLLTGLVLTQVFLGASVVWTHKAPTLTSVHVVTGAGLLMTCWLLVLRCHRAEQATTAATASSPAPSLEPGR